MGPGFSGFPGPTRLGLIPGPGGDCDERIRSVVGAVDVVLDGLGGATGDKAVDLLAPGGRLLSFTLVGDEWTSLLAVPAADGGDMKAPPKSRSTRQRAYAERVLAEAAAGRLRAVIGQRFPLDRAADAHTVVGARRTVGKTVLDVR
ncbi:zinc-binding dehydrogenase [Micromonospora craniellae]|uniref:zinc-binding dehydrogenase n=1 Tax=Micromonospora craniellae TaxID=2294034 RepID=UPI0013142886|nr:zinc-binding dehydrogenase [Micromonospora craniellae]QOC94478.1 zinc-binding dehydrogenase [Micromonospora craniellae]